MVLQRGFVQDEGTSRKVRASCVEGLEEVDRCGEGSMEVGVTCEEPSVLELDECTEELLKVSRHVELDSMNRPDGYSKRPRPWATDRRFFAFPTTFVDVIKGDAKQPEHRSRLCGKELKRCVPTLPGTFASLGPLECVTFLLRKALIWTTWSEWAVGTKDHVVGRIESSLSGRRPERDGDRQRSK